MEWTFSNHWSRVCIIQEQLEISMANPEKTTFPKWEVPLSDPDYFVPYQEIISY